jgi:hypothetical protein
MIRTLVTAALFLSGSLLAADLSGIWIGQIPVRKGDPRDIAFKFTQNGSRLSGKIYGDYKSSPIVEGTVSGDQITFVIATQEQAGNQTNDVNLIFKGVIKGEQIELTREREGPPVGESNPANSEFKPAFTLKRLL